jgi:hypothetical protein
MTIIIILLVIIILIISPMLRGLSILVGGFALVLGALFTGRNLVSGSCAMNHGTPSVR